MFNKKFYIEFSNNKIKYALLKKKKGKLFIYKLNCLDLNENNLEVNKFKDLLKKNKIRNKDVNIVVSNSKVITKIIEIPKLSAKDLKSLTTNNLETYFSVKVNDYVFDYKVIDTYEKENITQQSILLIATPKEDLEIIIKFVNEVGLKISLIDIYANSICNLYHNSENLSLIEIYPEEVNYISMENNKLFMHTTFDPNEQDSFSYDAEEALNPKINNIVTNIVGYLNFFSIKHYGQSIKKLYINGNSEDLELIGDKIKEKAGLEIYYNKKLDSISLHPSIKNQDNLFSYYSLFGLSLRDNKEKQINLYKSYLTKKSKKYIYKYSAIIGIITAILILFEQLGFPYIQQYQNNNKIEVLENELSNLQGIESLLKEKEQYQSLYIDKLKVVRSSTSMELNFIKLLDLIYSITPSNASLINYSIDVTGKINVTYKVNSIADTLLLLNKLKELDLFEDIPIDIVGMNNQQQSLSFNLTIQKDKIKDFYLNKEWIENE